MPVAPTTGIQNQAQESALRFVTLSDGASCADEAAKWALAAKNAIQVALTCEQIVKTRNAR